MIIAYFERGMLYDLSPRTFLNLYDDRETAYHADVIVSDGAQFDLSRIEDVQAIPMPDFPATWDILELSYIMKIRCGLVTDTKLLPSFVNKTLELMRASKMLWQKKDYLQVLRNYYRQGLFEEGDKFEAEYRLKYSNCFISSSEKAEIEHERTKEYFRQKWNKKHRTLATK